MVATTPYFLSHGAIMPITICCAGCGKNIRVADEFAGRFGKCSACNAAFEVPVAVSSATSVQATPAQAPGTLRSADRPAPGRIPKVNMRIADIQKLEDAGLITGAQRQNIIAHFALKEESGKFLVTISFIGA